MSDRDDLARDIFVRSVSGSDVPSPEAAGWAYRHAHDFLTERARQAAVAQPPRADAHQSAGLASDPNTFRCTLCDLPFERYEDWLSHLRCGISIDQPAHHPDQVDAAELVSRQPFEVALAAMRRHPGQRWQQESQTDWWVVMTPDGDLRRHTETTAGPWFPEYHSIEADDWRRVSP